MAGRRMPGHQEADSRWLVDRQVYERRRDGVRYVAWSRATQLRLIWLLVLLLLLAGGLGGATVWAWQRLGPAMSCMSLSRSATTLLLRRIGKEAR